MHVANLRQPGGLERRLCDYLAHRQDPSLHHVVVTTQLAPAIAAKLHDAGVEVFVPPRKHRVDPLAWLHFAHFFRRRRFDLAHCRNDSGHIWGGAAAWLAHTPAILGDEHGSLWNLDGWRNWAEQTAYRNLTLMVANSLATKRFIIERRRMPEERVRVIYDGIDPEPFLQLPPREGARQRLGLSAAAKVIAALGRLDTEKAFHVLIKALPRLVQRLPDAQVLIGGDGPLQEFLSSLAVQEGVAEHVHFLGYVAEVPAVLAASDLVVSTSLRETLGNVLIEAGFAGLPVVATRIDGIPEVVIDGSSGVLLRPTRLPLESSITGARPLPRRVLIDGLLQPPMELDPMALAESIIALLENPERCRYLGENARRHTLEKFTIRRYVQEIEALYREVST